MFDISGAKAIYDNLSAGCDYNGNTTIDVTDKNTKAVESVTFMRPIQQNVYIKVNLFNKDLPNDYENLIKNAVINNFYGLDQEVEIAGETLSRIIMHDDVYSSRFLPSILNANINSLLSVQVSLDNVDFSDFVHIQLDKEPILTADNITINVIDERNNNNGWKILHW